MQPKTQTAYEYSRDAFGRALRSRDAESRRSLCEAALMLRAEMAFDADSLEGMTSPRMAAQRRCMERRLAALLVEGDGPMGERLAQRCYGQARALGREIRNRRAKAARFEMPPA